MASVGNYEIVSETVTLASGAATVLTGTLVAPTGKVVIGHGADFAGNFRVSAWPNSDGTELNYRVYRQQATFGNISTQVTVYAIVAEMGTN